LLCRHVEGCGEHFRRYCEAGKLANESGFADSSGAKYAAGGGGLGVACYVVGLAGVVVGGRGLLGASFGFCLGFFNGCES
jgi:hypothetical protein